MWPCCRLLGVRTTRVCAYGGWVPVPSRHPVSVALGRWLLGSDSTQAVGVPRAASLFLSKGEPCPLPRGLRFPHQVFLSP